MQTTKHVVEMMITPAQVGSVPLLAAAQQEAPAIALMAFQPMQVMSAKTIVMVFPQ